MRFILMLLLLLSSHSLLAQLAFGGRISVNGLIPIKGNSIYDDQYFSTGTLPAFGTDFNVRYQRDGFSIESGIGLRDKTYLIKQDVFDFPGVVDHSGHYLFQMRVRTMEIPFTINKPLNLGKGLSINAGIIMVRNQPYLATFKSYDFDYTGDGILQIQHSSKPIWDAFWSPDLKLGVEWTKSSGRGLTHEFQLFGQYQSISQQLAISWLLLSTRELSKLYISSINPRMPFIAISYGLRLNADNWVKSRIKN